MPELNTAVFEKAKSTVTPLQGAWETLPAQIAEFAGSDTFLVYAEYAYAVALGKLVNGQFTIYFSDRSPEQQELPLTYLQTLRVFNKDAEFRAVRDGNEIHGRIRRDGTGEDCDILDMRYQLLGEADEAAGKSVLTNREGAYIPVPFSLNAHTKLALQARSYVSFPKIPTGSAADTGLMLFTDDRFLGLVNCKEPNKILEVE